MTIYTIDASHSDAAFTVRHMVVAKVRGNFKVSKGVLKFDKANPAASSVEVALDSASVSTGDANRDNHLRSADFFDVEKFPTLTFKSTQIETTDGKTGKIYGDLTIHGESRPVVIDADFLGEVKDPWGNNRVAFSGSTKINREDWGLTWNVALEAGGFLVGKDIEIALDVEGLPSTEAAAD
ncbi:MAG: YceI family protein [Anaerolineae bacterium]